MQSDEDMNKFLEWNSPVQLLGLGAGIIYKSPLGPISIWFGSLANNFTPAWYVNLGYTF